LSYIYILTTTLKHMKELIDDSIKATKEERIRTIRKIFLEYAQGNYHLEITQDDLLEIARRIVDEGLNG